MNGLISCSGFGVNHLDIAPQYAGVIMAISNTISGIAGILSPLIAGIIVTDQKVVI